MSEHVFPECVSVVDSHTEGMPTRVMINSSDSAGPTKNHVSAKQPETRPSVMYARSFHGVAVRGSLAIRRQGIYFTMITLALAQMLYFVCLQVPATGGEDGMQGVPRGKLLGMLDLTSDLWTAVMRSTGQTA